MTGPNLPQAVRQTREKLVDLLRELDREAADWVERVRVRAGKTPTVVVVGETNRGKSSLVNALLASPGLSPVDADEATATYLVINHGERRTARACYLGHREPVPFPPEQLADWVSGTRELPEGQVPPRYVEVESPVPLLTNLSIVDTPGVGGLSSKHGELAREAAADATVLLFVVDASAPLLAGELEFLRDLTGRVETVIFAMTKVDAFRGWREILDADRALLAEHAARFANADFVAVSPRMFELAVDTPDGPAAAMLRERSGIAELQTILQERLIGRSVMLAEANALRALSTALGALHVKLTVARRALSTGETEAVSLRVRRDRLVADRRSSARGWQLKLRGDIQRARVESNHEVARQVRDLQSWFRQAIDSADHRRLAQLPSEVDAALQLLSLRVSAALARRLAGVTDRLLADLFSPEELSVIRAQVAKGVRSPVVLRPPERRAATGEDRLLVTMGMASGFGVARLATLPLAGLGFAAITPFLLPATIVVGLGAGWWMARTRRHTAEKQYVKQWLTEAIGEARSTMDHMVAEQLIEAEQQLASALDDTLARRIDEIEAELKDVDRAMKLVANERSRRLSEMDKRIGEVTAGITKVEGLLAEIRAVRDRI